MKASELRKMSTEDLEAKLVELRRELLRLNAIARRGTIGKESGLLRYVRRDIARALTVLDEREGKKGS